MSDATDFRELRNAYGCFATGIVVVTAIDGEGRAVGITANSFSSLSLEPPLVLWCIGRESVTFDVFRATDCFVISILDAGGLALSRRFAQKGEHFVHPSEGVATELGPPALANALAVFECETHARHEGGDHIILVGRVARFAYAAEAGARPLIYFRGRYRLAADLAG